EQPPRAESLKRNPAALLLGSAHGSLESAALAEWLNRESSVAARFIRHSLGLYCAGFRLYQTSENQQITFAAFGTSLTCGRGERHTPADAERAVEAFAVSWILRDRALPELLGTLSSSILDQRRD